MEVLIDKEYIIIYRAIIYLGQVYISSILPRVGLDYIKDSTYTIYYYISTMNIRDFRSLLVVRA